MYAAARAHRRKYVARSEPKCAQKTLTQIHKPERPAARTRRLESPVMPVSRGWERTSGLVAKDSACLEVLVRERGGRRGARARGLVRAVVRADRLDVRQDDAEQIDPQPLDEVPHLA